MNKANIEVSSKATKNSEIQLKIKVLKEAQKKYYDQAAKEISQNISVNGFRKGHIPTNLVEEKVGKPMIQAHALDLALPDSYSEAIKKEEIEPIAMPKIEVDSLEKMEFTATCAIMPEVKIKSIDKIKVEVKEPKVTKKDLDAAIERALTQHIEWKDVKRTAKKDDRVEIDFSGFDKDGNPIPNTESKNYPLVLGSGVFIPGFEENIEGMKVDEEKSFQVTFPKDYHADKLKNAEVTFKVKVNKIEESKSPKLTDKFVKEVLKLDKTLEEYKQDLKENLLKQKKHESVHEAENKVFEKLLKESELTLSEILVDEEFKLLKQEISADLQKRGQSFENFAADLEKREGKKFKEAYHDKALERVKLRFIVDHVIKTKKLDVTEAEIEADIQNKIETADESIKKHVEDYYKQNPQAKESIKQHLLMDKLIKLFISEK
jgi:trigger factor